MKLSSHTSNEDRRFYKVNQPKAAVDESRFYSCSFNQCSFGETLFSKCLFEECTFTAGDLSLVMIPDTRIDDCVFRNCKMIGIDWTVVRREIGMNLEFHECDLSYCTFMKVNLQGSLFSNCFIKEADFQEVTLKEVSFAGSDLHRTRFSRCDLAKADFRDADNYFFDPRDNRCKGAKVKFPQAAELLRGFGIEAE